VLLKRLALFKGTVIISLHGLDIEGASRARGLERRLWQFVLRGADKIVACSDNLRATAIALSPAADNSSVTIHNGVDVERLHADSQRGISPPDLLPSRPFILNVGTFEHKKGQDVLLRAFDSVSRTFRHLELVIVGRSGPMKESLKALVRDLGLEDRVRLVADLPHEQVLQLLEKAMLFVLPSRAEPFGIALLEAGAFGVPIVASNVGGVPEFITHDWNGRLVDPDDAGALAREIAALLQNESDRKRLAANLKRDVTEKLTWERAYRQYRRLLDGETLPPSY
jgi:glycosyltransferase involved in cell wall biosynthesis